MNRLQRRVVPSLFRLRPPGQGGLRRVAANTAWLFGDQLVRMVMGLLVGVWVARYLGPQQYGILSYALALAALVGPIASLGLNSIAVREIVRVPGRAAAILGSTFALKSVSGVLAFLLLAGVTFAIHGGNGVTSWLVTIVGAGLIFQSFDTVDLWFQSRVQSKYTVCGRNAAFVVVSVVKLILIQARAPLVAFALAALLESALAALGLTAAYRLAGNRLREWRWSLSVGLTLLREGWPLLLSGMAIMIYMKIDQVMLGNMLGSEAVGLYSAAVRMSEVWYFLPMAITSSVFPSIVSAKEASEELYYRRLRRLFALMWALASVIAVPVTVLSPAMTAVLFGDAYAPAAAILAIHIWAVPFVFLGVAQGPWNVSEGLTRLHLQRTLLGAAANVFLNLVLIPPYGGVGAAIATVVSYALSASIANALDARTRPILAMQMKSMYFVKYLV